MMDLTPDMQKLLAREMGLQVISKLRDVPVPDEFLKRVTFPRCAHCRRRPELRPMRGDSWLRFRTGIEPSNYADMSGGQPLPEVVVVPRYEILPCCSATYIHEITGPTRRQKLAAKR